MHVFCCCICHEIFYKTWMIEGQWCNQRNLHLTLLEPCIRVASEQRVTTTPYNEAMKNSLFWSRFTDATERVIAENEGHIAAA